MKKNENECRKLLQNVVQKTNGWYACEDFQLLLHHERERNHRKGGQASFVFLDFSDHYKIPGLMRGKSYYNFLVQVVEIINANTRRIDTKSITVDYKISILLVDTPLVQARMFIEKLSQKLLNHFAEGENSENLALIQTMVITAFSLGSLEEIARPHQTPQEVEAGELPLSKVANAYFEETSIAMDNLSQRLSLYNRETNTPKESAGIFYNAGNGQQAMNGNRLRIQNGNAAGLTNDSVDLPPRAEAPLSPEAKTQFKVINGGKNSLTTVLNGNGNRFKPGMKILENRPKTVLDERENFYFNWDIFSLVNAPARLRETFRSVKTEESPHIGYYFLKRSLDILGAGVGLLLLSPIFLAIVLAVKISSKGPALFRQKRIGYRGRLFTFLKFRSMRTGNDNSIHKAYMEKLIAGRNEEINNGSEDEPLFKIANDPRITPVGNFLRKTSLDEIPQLINVLKGDMSLVGPRPPIPYEVDMYKTWHLRRITEVRPGITGLWQVYGRNQTTFDDMVRLDLRYVKERSLWLDLKLIARTLRLMFNPKSGM